MTKVVVASQNPVKIEATKIAFEKMFPQVEFKFEGVSVPSGVSDQPLSDDETLIGATNRANNAFNLKPDADYWVGLEGGIEKNNGEMKSFAWMVVKSKTGKIGKGRTASFFLPKKIIDLIESGIELGSADDIVFGKTNSKQSNGSIGILTGDVITRTTLYEQGMIIALIPFKQKKLY